MKAWILVADSRRAKIFEMIGKFAGMVEVADFIYPHVDTEPGGNPAARVVTGRAGTRHGMEPRALPKEHEVKEFAAGLASYLDKQFSIHAFSELVLVASPEFLGAVRGALHGNLQAAVTHSINKDLTRCTPAEIMEQVKGKWSNLDR